MTPALVICMVVTMAMSLSGTQAKTTEWSLSTSDTRLVVGVSDGRPVVKWLGSVGSAHNWAGSGMSVPLMSRVWQDGSEMATEWVYQSARREKRSGKLILTFLSENPKMALRSIWRARPGHGPVEHWMEIENQSGQELTVSHQDSLSLPGLTPGGSSQVWWIKRGASNASSEGGTFTDPVGPDLNLNLVSDVADGASPVPWAAIQAGDTRGLYVGWEFSGLGRVGAESGGSDGSVDISVGNKPDFKTDIGPAETFFVPAAFVGCYTGDVEQGSYLLHRFVIEKLRLPMAKGIPDPILAYNVYFEPWNEEGLLKSAAKCYDFGFEVFMPDAIWMPEQGDWRWNLERYPNGGRPIEEFVHANRMKFALWFAWSMVMHSDHPDSVSARGRHTDWLTTDPDLEHMNYICLASPGAVDWIIKTTERVTAENKLDYVKSDGAIIRPACNKSDHKHRYGVDVSYWATMGYNKIQDNLRRVYPNLIMENCDGGGHIKDFGVIKRTHYTVTTDNLSALPDRQSIYDSTYAMPPMVLQAYTVNNYFAKEGDDPEPYLWRSAMMGAWEIDPNNSNGWTEAQRASVKQAVKVYKSWIRPILKDCKVHHILPRPDGKNWDGMFYWSAGLKKGTVYIFRPKSDTARQTVKLRGLSPLRGYRVWSQDGSIQSEMTTGSILMNNGLEIALPGYFTSDIIFVEELG